MPKLAVTEGPGRRVPILARVTPTVREELEAAAGASGRSLSQEIETRLQASFEQDEIKAEMRGTIAALEQRIASMEEGDKMLWPDESARLLGKSFAMTLAAVRHATGQDWREGSTAAPIVAGVVRRMMDECSRGGSLYSELFDQERIAKTTDSIARFMVDSLREKLPPLPENQDDPANRTTRARTIVTFRNKATGALLELVRGPEFDMSDPSDRPDAGPEHRAAVDRFRPIRDTVEAETFLAYAMKDGSSVWHSLSEPGKKVFVPAARLAGQEEAARLMAGVKPARGQDSEVFDEALFAETMGPRRDDGEDKPVPEQPQVAPAPKPRRHTKAEA